MKKIVIIGPESTGKSTLCKQLAKHYDTEWVPEYAREYLEKLGKKYSYEDLLSIAKGQVALEDEYENRLAENRRLEYPESHSPLTPHHPIAIGSPFLIIDTDMYVMKVWCEFVFGKCHPWILRQVVTRKYDLYLLCNIDLPWVNDELREYPDFESRKTLYKMYFDILVNQQVPWAVINGNSDERFQAALQVINKQFGLTS